MVQFSSSSCVLISWTILLLKPSRPPTSLQSRPRQQCSVLTTCIPSHTHTHTPQSNRGQAPCVALADAQPQQARNNRTCYSSLSVNPYRSALARSPITPPQTCPACHPCRQGRLSRCVCSVSNPGPLKWSSFSRAGLIVFLQHWRHKLKRIAWEWDCRGEMWKIQHACNHRAYPVCWNTYFELVISQLLLNLTSCQPDSRLRTTRL